MKANELRIGNLVDVMNRSNAVHLPTGIELRVIAIGLFKAQCVPSDIKNTQVTPDVIMDIPLKDLIGIPLTEVIFLNYGFSDAGVGMVYKLNRFVILSWAKEARQFELVCINEGETVVMPVLDIVHLHHIQNFVYGFSSEELTIKEPV